MAKLDIGSAYRQFVKTLQKDLGRDAAARIAIGGQFEAIGIIEREILIQYGLPVDGYVIDVGCGSGRLAKPLSEYLHGRYLGIDVVPDLVEYARELTARPDWRFETTTGLQIPEKKNVADVVCFFSVLTHLLHEQSYVYLEEARRVLKPGGIIVFSFLEFARPNHWAVFAKNIADLGRGDHLNMFISRDGIETWAQHLNLQLVAIEDGDKPHVPLRQPVKFEDGTVMSGKGNLGQSVCVLRKP